MFHFNMSKYLSKIIIISMVNRQTKFCIFKFGVCLHTPNFKTKNVESKSP